jgi:hypothetical protein
VAFIDREPIERGGDCCLAETSLRGVLHRDVSRAKVDLADAPPLPERVATLVDEGSVQPRVEPIGVAQCRQLYPGCDECVLCGLVRIGFVAEDRSGGSE